MTNKVTTTATEFAGITPELWSASWYPTLLAALPFNDSVSRDYEGEISALGSKLHINDFPEFGDAEVLTEDQAANADSITANDQELVINKRVAKDFILTKNAEKQSLDAENKLRDHAFYSIMKKMQDIIIAETVPSASTPDHQISYDSSTTLALADIQEAKSLLDDANVEDDGRTMIVGSSQQNDLFSITGFISRDFIPGGSPMTEGAIKTQILGFNFKWTTRVGNVSYFFNRLYQVLAVQEDIAIGVYDQGADGKRSKRVNMDVLFGTKQLSNLRVVSVG